MMEFHISRKARDRYQFAESLFSYSGNVVFANLAACREFAYKMNTVRDVEKHPERAVHAGQLYAMGLIDEASHVLMARYRERFDPEVMTSALDWFAGKVGADAMGKLLLTFVDEFPGMAVMRGEKTPVEWLAGQTDGTPHWAVAFEEMILLWTANRNEAFDPFKELFEEKSLAERTVYRKVTRQLPEYFATRPLIPLPDAKPMNLLELLRAPAVGAPRSLSDQLALIRKLWKPLIGDSLERFLLIAGEILREEELAIWKQFNPPDETARRRRESGRQQWPGVVSTAEVPEFGDPAHEYEKFSPDQAWMPTAVMIAKSTYVWLAQLSRQYGRWIKRLDEIPDEELATLARRGLNTLWLIGVWERSRASRTIKQLCGNSDAVASAYSLFDYTIADDLGGETAYVNLRDRAFKYGIRLASDMVPNHMGIDSPWVVEHPDWFISRPEPPYPVYSFNGPDLSSDGRVEIKIEDHYYEQSDAAVVFQRRDRSSGETRYIYHGNDGTSFPWNDTAQLDYLNPAVREQVIQTILHVARLFPVIRFDAAMTLAKRHFHRLWFPGPGASGAIPSRAEYGMSQAEFDRAMPNEFWREVVDRVAAEVPNTLLLAEAFWLMEGYFVRTLGMHRVYNSAFMVMLRDEDNAKYRSVIKKTLEFDPDIMKRYVNFMSNPDERTAIDQFGKGDKCFGVAAMMATLPGLPMFGHGQIEGFTEKYGMEYQRPRYEENPDFWMVQRHEREIAPLLKRRSLFAESGNFLLYDFYTGSGKVDENVFAYSNRKRNERALVVFNNRYGDTHGTIDYSTAYADKGANQLRQQRVGEGLGFGSHAGAVLAWRDSLTGLEYLRRASDLSRQGLTLDLHAYQCHVFVDWCELYSTQEKPWDRLSDQLNGRGVPSLDDALINLELQPVHDALRGLLDPAMVRLFADLAEHPRTVAVGVNAGIEAERTRFFGEAWTRCESFMRVAQKAYLTQVGGTSKLAADPPANPGLLGAAFRARLRAAMRIPGIEALFPVPWTAAARRVLPSPSPQLTATAMWGPVLAWCALELLAESFDVAKPELVALDLFDRLRLREPFAQVFAALGYVSEEAWRVAARVKVVLLAGASVGAQEEIVSAQDVGSIGRENAHRDSLEVSRHDLTDSGKTQAEPSEVSEHDVSRADSTPSSPRGLAPTTAAQPISTQTDFAADQLTLVPALRPALWLDPDVRWLTGVHEAEGREYLVREPYEELLWWLQMPSLLRLASEISPESTARNRAAVEAMNRSIKEALAAAEAAGYRVDLLTDTGGAEAADEEPLPEIVAATDEGPEAVAEIAIEATAETAIDAAAEVADEPEMAQEFEPAADEQPEQIEPEIDTAAEPTTELAAESVAQSVSEPAPDPIVEAAAEEELTPETDCPFVTVEPEQIEPEIEAAAEPAIELTAEANTEAVVESVEEAAPETVDEVPPESKLTIEPATAEPAGLVEPEAAASDESEAAAEVGSPCEDEPEPESSSQTKPLSVEEAQYTEPEGESTPDAVIEAFEEGASEPTAGADAGADVVVEHAPESAVEHAVEHPDYATIVAVAEPPAEPELAAEVEPTVAAEPESVAPEPEAAAETAIECVAESITEAEPETVTEAVAEPAPEEEAGAEAAAEVATEPADEVNAQDAVEPEPLPAATFAPVEAPQIDEAENQTVSDFVGEIVIVEPESDEELEFAPAEEPQPAEPEIVADAEPAFEAVSEPIADAVIQVEVEPEPLPVEVQEPAGIASEPEIMPSFEQEPGASTVESEFSLSEFAVTNAKPEIESPAESAFKLSDFAIAKPEPEPEPVAEPAAKVVEDGPSLAEHLEPPASKLEFLTKYARSAAEKVHSLAERWEPPAPKIEFEAKTPAEIKTGEDVGPSRSESWEPTTPKSDSGNDVLAEPRNLAELLLSLNQRWEPPAPKIDLVAKPAAEGWTDSRESESHDDSSEPKEPQADERK
ncbi:MAG: alpha-amylase family glycosyl hydrolase [Terracidiphilus sp.]|jgi:hypothetical protein